MSEKELDPPRATSAEVLALLNRIKANAARHAPELADNRALEGEENLNTVGDTWLRQEIRHTNQLHYVRLFILGLLLFLVILWLASIPVLLYVVGTKWNNFQISDAVIITYIGSTTISVLGLLRIAARWLFTGGLPDLADSIKKLLHKN